MPSRYRGGLRSGRFKGLIEYYRYFRVANLQVHQPIKQWERHQRPYYHFILTHTNYAMEWKGKVYLGKRPYASEDGYVNRQK